MRERDKRIVILLNVSATHSLNMRAEKLFSRLKEKGYKITMLPRERKRFGTIIRNVNAIVRLKPAIVYVIDFGYSTIFPVLLLKLFLRFRFVYDTGDIVYELFRSTRRGIISFTLARTFEPMVWKIADAIVVRGIYFERFLKDKNYKNVYFVPDGVEIELFKPLDVSALRRSLGLENVLTIGMVGSLNWIKRYKFCYGWELLSTLCYLKKYPVKGIIIGDGSGLDRLKEIVRDNGLEDKILFLGRIPYEKLPEYINLMDICLSTQSNDIVGEVRTTGKLPLYMACARYILATRVGTAREVLPEEMLLDYKGVKDKDYPERLAKAIKNLLNERYKLDSAKGLRRIAEGTFDYNLLSKRIDEIISKLCVYGKD